MHTIERHKLLMLRPDDIRPSPYQPRQSFDEHELQRLADSISASGVIQPISVRKTQDGGYELIAGERRLKAARIAALRRIPCILHKADDMTAAFYSVIENRQHTPLDFFEEAQSISRLIDTFSLTHTETALRLGMSLSALSDALSLLRLSPELKERITAARLSEKHARLLLRLPAEKREAVLLRIISEGMNIRQSEELCAAVLTPEKKEVTTEKAAEPVRKISIGDVRFFANSLNKLIDTVQSAGIDVKTHKTENDKYIEYKVRISKESLQTGYQQLKIC